MAAKPSKAEVFDSLVGAREVGAFYLGDDLVDGGPVPEVEGDDERFDEFCELDADGVVLRCIRQYVRAAIPKPRELLAAELWSISCLPSTNGGARLFTLSCPGIETLFGGLQIDGPPWFRVGLGLDELSEQLWPETCERLGLEADSFKLPGYSRPAVSMSVTGDRFEAVMADAAIVRAARSFVVSNLVAGGDTYSRYCSLPLAAAVLR